MPFETVETIKNTAKATGAKITYLRKSSPTGKRPNPDKKPRLSISIPNTVCGAVKAKAFTLLFGTGKDLGRIRIKGVKAGDGIEPTLLMHATVFRFGYVPKLGDDIFDGGHRPVRKVGDDEFEIEVPASWYEPAATED